MNEITDNSGCRQALNNTKQRIQWIQSAQMRAVLAVNAKLGAAVSAANNFLVNNKSIH